MSKQIFFVPDNQIRFDEFRTAPNGTLNGRLSSEVVQKNSLNTLGTTLP